MDEGDEGVEDEFNLGFDYTRDGMSNYPVNNREGIFTNKGPFERDRINEIGEMARAHMGGVLDRRTKQVVRDQFWAVTEQAMQGNNSQMTTHMIEDGMGLYAINQERFEKLLDDNPPLRPDQVFANILMSESPRANYPDLEAFGRKYEEYLDQPARGMEFVNINGEECMDMFYRLKFVS